ncbi:VOC family protein [candidate division WOR-3 bacterium]|nr:VOC family protein [candidate division WOR-3 bacterium]
MHGFTHIEIPTNDPQKSKAFYGKLFGWKLNDTISDYVMFSTGDNQGGAFTTNAKPSRDGVVLYIEVEDITEKLTEIEAAGGKKLKNKTQISPQYGYYCTFTDPCGNIMALWSRQ